MMRSENPSLDTVDHIVQAWERERPDLDFSPLEVLSRLWRLAKKLDGTRKQAFHAHSLESWEFDVLSALRRSGAPYQLSPKELMAHTMVSSGTMTNRIDRLTARELVERRADPADGRSILVTMTSTGQHLVDGAISTLLEAEALMLAQMSATEQLQLAALLKTLSLEPTNGTQSSTVH